MTEIEKLLIQKKEIEQKIRELKSKEICFGHAKLMTETWACRPDSWNIALRQIYEDEYLGRKTPRWFSVVKFSDRDKTIDTIDVIIRDLQGLKDQLRGEKE